MTGARNQHALRVCAGRIERIEAPNEALGEDVMRPTKIALGPCRGRCGRCAAGWRQPPCMKCSPRDIRVRQGDRIYRRPLRGRVTATAGRWCGYGRIFRKSNPGRCR